MEFAGGKRGGRDARGRQARPNSRHRQGGRRARHSGAARKRRSGGGSHAPRPHARRRHAGRRSELQAFRHARRDRGAGQLRQRESGGREGRKHRGQGPEGQRRQRQQALHPERGGGVRLRPARLSRHHQLRDGGSARNPDAEFRRGVEIRERHRRGAGRLQGYGRCRSRRGGERGDGGRCQELQRHLRFRQEDQRACTDR